MAFTEAEKVQLRRWAGRPPIGVAYDSIFEGAIRSVEGLSDGGATVAAVRGWLGELAAIETQWKTLYEQAQVNMAGKTTLDVARGVATLARIGRMYVGNICDALYTKPARDVFCPPEYGA